MVATGKTVGLQLIIFQIWLEGRQSSLSWTAMQIAACYNRAVSKVIKIRCFRNCRDVGEHRQQQKTIANHATI